MGWPPFQVALALGGGGARGFAHAGVLEVLAENQIPPQLIVGTSMGAIVGGAYALDPDPAALRARIDAALGQEGVRLVERQLGVFLAGEQEPTWRGALHGLIDAMRRLVLWNRQAVRQSLLDGALVAELIESLVHGATFDDLAIPFHAVAFDLNSNSDVLLSDGDLATAMRASSAVPGVFEPVVAGERLLVDGAVFQEVPTTSARRLGADFVLALDVGAGIGRGAPTSAAEMMWRVLAVRGERLRRESCEAADFLIAPDVSHVHWSEFSRAEECYAAGVAAARERLEPLQAALRRARRRSFPARFVRRARAAIATSSRGR